METENKPVEQQIDNVATNLSELKVSTEGGEEKTQPSDEGRPSTKPANGETTDAADAGAEQSTEAEAATTDEAGGLLPSPAPAQDPSAYAADPTNFEIKHPLQNRWSLWYDNPRKRTSADTWGNHLKHVVEFDTVEDFWRLYNNVMPASRLEHGSNYHLFKAGIEPKWEDSANTRGGQWVVTFSNKQRKEKLDKLWLYTILACIGEAFEEEEEVCGCVVSIRKAQDRIAIWTRTASKEAAVRSIGMQLKRTLEMPAGSVVGYQVHSDSMKTQSSSSAKYRYEV
jgi:translation initiation factor 4E